ncbi:MAG TPA: AAA family ATPase [Bryobacteraceae bacterium]|nr:AAA family ATPase [Bryobacteraceae bacterium]
MLTRLYIDNFRCFVNFEYRPARTQLILGANGSGKSSFIEALLFLHRFAVQGESIYGISMLYQRTRWQSRPDQTFELEARLDGESYAYHLAIGPELERTRVKSEYVHLNGRPIFEFSNGEVRHYSDSFEPKPIYYPDDLYRSALSALGEGNDIRKLTRFRHWFRGLACFRMNPFVMAAMGDECHINPSADLSDFAAWYNDLRRRYPTQNEAFLASLRAVFDGFEDLRFDWGPDSALEAWFAGETQFRFNELSDGQRCLICLYAILHFVLARGHTAILDEPDNFISLREIQPWLMAAEDAVENSGGQILIISHHPEIINQLATSGGVRFVRDGIGPVRVEDFHYEPDSGLEPAELVARGWKNG